MHFCSVSIRFWWFWWADVPRTQPNEQKLIRKEFKDYLNPAKYQLERFKLHLMTVEMKIDLAIAIWFSFIACASVIAMTFLLL